MKIRISDDLAERAGTSATSSAFENKLRARGLAAYPRKGFMRATTLLFPETMSVDLDAGRYSTA